MAALKIGGVDNTDTAKENIGALAGASNVENPSAKIASVESYKENLHHEFKENEVILRIQIVKRMKWKWQEEHEHMEKMYDVWQLY